MNEPYKARILVVDDEQSMREFLEIFLAREGYAVCTAADVDTAIAIDVVCVQMARGTVTDVNCVGCKLLVSVVFIPTDQMAVAGTGDDIHVTIIVEICRFDAECHKPSTTHLMTSLSLRDSRSSSSFATKSKSPFFSAQTALA